MALTISAGISALATSCANSQNNSLSPLLRKRGMRWVARHSGNIVQKPIVVENDLCGWLVMQNLLRDWFTRFWWPVTSIPQRC